MLRTFQARWQTGYLVPEDVPDRAASLLAAGWDTPALRQLAGLHQPTDAEVRPLIDRSIRELQLGPLSQAEALRLVVLDTAQQLVGGAIEPYAAAAILHGLWSDSNHPEYLAVFVSALDDYEEFPEKRGEITAEVLMAAENLLRSLTRPPLKHNEVT